MDAVRGGPFVAGVALLDGSRRIPHAASAVADTRTDGGDDGAFDDADADDEQAAR